jgi:probable addiction module antidote protein
MTIKVSNFDVAEYLNDEESIAAYLSAIVEEGDPKLLLAAISDIAKARGMSKIASDSGLGRESLYKALNPDAKPRFDTILRVLNSLGLQIGFNSISPKKNKTARTKYLHSSKSKNKRTLHLIRGSAAMKNAGRKTKG